jgi:Na+-driven multidrug efflux pump
MRAKKAIGNAIWGFLYEIVVLVCGFILPRLVLTSFGSEYNGVTNAINQFLRVIALFQAGISGVAMAALYKPLSENNTYKISVIVKTTEGFIRKVIYSFIVFILILASLYPFLVINEFDWFFTASLVLIMSLSTVAQYFFGRTYQILLNADQHQRLISIVNICKLIANTVISVIMINKGYGIREVKLAATSVYVITPILFTLYTKRKYRIVSDVEKDNSLIKQRWDGFVQQVAGFINANTDLIILSLFSNVYEVSVYSIYGLVFYGVIGLFSPLTSGVESAFGNMIAKDEQGVIGKNLRIYEQVIFTVTTFLFTVTLLSTLSFVSLYTTNISDVDYLRPSFLYIMIAAYMFMCFRFPYESIARAAGHFRQTRNPAFFEAGLNIVLSVILVFPFGIIGVAIGTLAAYVFRAIRYAVYVSHFIVQRELSIFLQRVFISSICLLLTVGIYSMIPLQTPSNYYEWALNALVASAIVFALIIIVELLFYHDDLKELVKMVKLAIRKNEKSLIANK